MERNLFGIQCKYRYEQQLVRHKEKYRRGLYSSLSSVHQQQFDSLKPDSQQKNLNLISVQEGETFIEDDDVVIDEGNICCYLEMLIEITKGYSQMMQMDDPDAHEEVYPLSRYSPETQLKMKIVLFIRHANINKTNSSALLNLIRGISAIEIPNNCDRLWNDLNVKFSYKTIIYCSSCFKKLQHIKQRCFNDEYQNQMHKINSELILFDVADEIHSIAIKNYHLIK
ncbi:unnamed protein product [Rotaria sp. Silwood2]|nr:unnamed protein product [Rotaria sp. Silwood2]